MKHTLFVASIVMAACVAVSAQAADKLDRTVLPIPEPGIKPLTAFDARKATPPPRFQVKAPANAPNVLLIMIDDMRPCSRSATCWM